MTVLKSNYMYMMAVFQNACILDNLKCMLYKLMGINTTHPYIIVSINSINYWVISIDTMFG